LKTTEEIKADKKEKERTEEFKAFERRESRSNIFEKPKDYFNFEKYESKLNNYRDFRRVKDHQF
jgi:hypothetical protein